MSQDETNVTASGGQAAGRDIINQAPLLQIGGQVSAALNVHDAGTVHIHVDAASGTTPASVQDINRVVSTLLRTCDEAGCKQVLQRISLALFNSSTFKNLAIEQLLKLQRIADELATQALDAKARLDSAEGALAQAVEAKGSLQEKLAQQITAAAQQAQQSQRQIDALRQAKPARPLCQTCSSATANLAKARRGVVTMGITAMLALAATSYLSFTHFQTNQTLKAVQARLTVCEFAGQPYSVGTVLVRENAPDWRCIASSDAVSWEEIKSKNKRKP